MASRYFDTTNPEGWTLDVQGHDDGAVTLFIFPPDGEPGQSEIALTSVQTEALDHWLTAWLTVGEV